ncbi:MAG: glycosyltransferase family 4 protein [Arthrobacter sp.]
MSSSQTKPRVLLLTDNLKVGGVQTVVVRLARELSSRGYRVGVAASNEGKLWDELPAACCRHYIPRRPGPWGSVATVIRLRKVLKTGQYDIVHSHQRGVSLLARIAGMGHKVRLVEHVHNVFLPVTRRFTSFRGDVLIACGSKVAEMLRHDYKRPADRIHTILNGVPDPFAEGYRALAAPKSKDRLKIVGIGRVSPQKNPDGFISVIHNLNNLGLSFDAEWIGDGELLNACRERTASLGMGNLVFSGSSSDVASKLADADILLMTSKWEGLPLVLLEAMSLGVGAVVPDIGSCGDAIRTGQNGLLYAPTTSPQDLARKLADLFGGDEWRSWGVKGRHRYENAFSLDRMIDELETLYTGATRP